MQRNYPVDRRNWHLSVLFRDTQLFQELLFKLVSHKFPTNFPPKSYPFLTCFQTISNRITNPIIHQHQFKMSHIKTQILLAFKEIFFANCQDVSKFKSFLSIKILRTSKVSQRSKLKRSDPKAKIFPRNVKES